MLGRLSIYVEILVRASLETLWLHTQDPALHERWDLRFSRIEYLPRGSDAEPQRFRYATRLGFGLSIVGEGTSVGQRNLPGGARASFLKFGSAQPWSLIREGGGYWKYLPSLDGIRFLTRYDYKTRFGWPGTAFDRLVFRPLMGWATAWSFDRLRLWLERGIPPAMALRLFLARTLARTALIFVFAYHGLVPKLLCRDADELAMLRDAHVPTQMLPAALVGAGAAELLFALALLIFWRSRWPAMMSIGLMLAATAGATWNSPQYLSAAFNPVSLNACVAVLALIDLLLLDDAPSAVHCRREPLGEEASIEPF